MTRIRSFLSGVSEWAASRSDVAGVLLIGSYARGQANQDSDVDLIVISDFPIALITDHAWVQTFGSDVEIAREDWGTVQSVRARFPRGLEVEFGIAGTNWLEVPLDAGTKQVLDRGFEVVYEREGYLSAKLVMYPVDKASRAITSNG